MRLTPKPPEIPDVGGFTAENDLFELREFAERLTNVLERANEPLVVLLDGAWGSGKSVFSRQWAGLLRERGAQVIYFDAFQNDHHEDAFVPISAEILAAVENVLGDKDQATQRYVDGAKKVGVALAPLGLRIASRAATAGLLSLEDIEAGGEALKSAIGELAKESEKVVERAVAESLKKAKDSKETLQAYRNMLSELSSKMSEDAATEGPTLPTVVFVDELDRCNPHFSLSIIERIKHLLSVENVCFVLVTHALQLEGHIESAYGAKTDSRSYLENFYTVRFSLPSML